MSRATALMALTLLLAPRLAAQTAADTAAIRGAALDYAEGWYTADADRMARALSPELVKRVVLRDTTTAHDVIQTMGKSVLVNNTRRAAGHQPPAAEQRRDVRILDIYRGVAVVRVTMSGWVDFLQLARVDGQWVIVNVLWQPAEGPAH